MRFLVVGAGSWGTAFSRVLLERGHEVVLACRTREQAEAIASTGRNPRYLQGVDLSGVEAVTLADALGVTSMSSSPPCPARPSARWSRRCRAMHRCSASRKGLDPNTGERLSTRVRGRSVAVLSGPNMAEEIAEGLPTAP